MSSMRLCTCAGAVLALVCPVFFAGCPKPNDGGGSFDPRMAGIWSNRVRDITQKTFRINPDGSFSASINPGIGGRGTVTGKLVPDNGEYIMTAMAETAGADWGKAVGGFNSTYVQAVFSGDDAFELKCKGNALVEKFFGALFYRETPGAVFDYTGDNAAPDNSGDGNGAGNDGGSGSAYSLTGSWSNNKKGIPEKTFAIAADGSFTVSVDPGLGGRGTVTGKLAAEGDEYKLQDMEGPGDKFWGKAVGTYNNTLIQITFSDKDTFDLKCKDNKVVASFFGGAFYRISQRQTGTAVQG